MAQNMHTLKMNSLSREATISFEWHRRTKNHALFSAADGSGYTPCWSNMCGLYVNCQLQ